jgi:hypothetical protein
MIIPQDRIMYKDKYCVAGARLTYMWDSKTGASPREIFDFETDRRSIVTDDSEVRLATSEERFKFEEQYFHKQEIK